MTDLRPSGSRWLGAVLLAAIAAVVLYVGARTIEIALRPAAPEPGELAPSFTVTSLDGEEITLDALRGRVVVLDFWATWCSGCVAFQPAADRIDRDYRDRGLTWLALHVEPGTADDARSFLQSRSSSVTAAMIPAALGERWGIAQTPSYVVIDRAGRVDAIYHHMASEPQLRKRIEALLAR